MNKLLLASLMILATQGFAQTKTEPTIFRITSAYSSFPDTGRAKGHIYDTILYSTAPLVLVSDEDALVKSF